MKKITPHFFIATLGTLILLVTSCTSVPETQYYTLVAENNVSNIAPTTTNKAVNIGVGPLVIPNILDNFSIISIEKNNQISLSAYHLWGGNLKDNINQVLADNISNYLGINGVWPFPWDNRNRPELQVRIVFERFIGERGKNIILQAKWTILTDNGRKELMTHKYRNKKSLQDDSYLTYVKGLNTTLNEFSLEVSQKLNTVITSLK